MEGDQQQIDRFYQLRENLLAKYSSGNNDTLLKKVTHSDSEQQEYLESQKSSSQKGSRKRKKSWSQEQDEGAIQKQKKRKIRQDIQKDQAIVEQLKSERVKHQEKKKRKEKKEKKKKKKRVLFQKLDYVQPYSKYILIDIYSLLRRVTIDNLQEMLYIIFDEEVHMKKIEQIQNKHFEAIRYLNQTTDEYFYQVVDTVKKFRYVLFQTKTGVLRCNCKNFSAGIREQRDPCICDHILILKILEGTGDLKFMKLKTNMAYIIALSQRYPLPGTMDVQHLSQSELEEEKKKKERKKMSKIEVQKEFLEELYRQQKREKQREDEDRDENEDEDKNQYKDEDEDEDENESDSYNEEEKEQEEDEKEKEKKEEYKRKSLWQLLKAKWNKMK